jgi:hypothetical protein
MLEACPFPSFSFSTPSLFGFLKSPSVPFFFLHPAFAPPTSCQSDFGRFLLLYNEKCHTNDTAKLSGMATGSVRSHGGIGQWP